MTRWRRKSLFVTSSVLCLSGLILFAARNGFDHDAIVQRLRGQHTVADRVTQFGPHSRAKWQTIFAQRNLEYPPQKLLLLGLKHEKQLQVFAPDDSRKWRLLKTFPVLAASGKLGPKLSFGDFQVPEGFYRIESLNPNSAYHLALRVNYPNDFDRAQAKRDGRSNLGGDIMIHGSNASIGCLAMGDAAIEELFVLAADTRVENIEVILSPLDFRVEKLPDEKRTVWVEKLHRQIARQLITLPLK